MNKKALKRKVKFVVKPVMNYVRNQNYRTYVQYAKYYKTCEVLDNAILYESRDGKSMTDSPFAVFTYLLDKPEYQHLQHVWSVENFQALKPIINEYKSYSNVRFVKRGSKEYLKAVASSKYLFNNSTFQPFVTPKPNQVYVNTWHGTPLKKMGFDIPGNPSISRNVVRNFLSASHILSPNPHTTDIFLRSYKLDGLYGGHIIEDGYPRIDFTFQTNRDDFFKKLTSYGMKFSPSKKVIVYAPTWKGAGSVINNDMEQIIDDMRKLEEKVGDNYSVFVKVHPFLYKEAVKYPAIQHALIPDYIDTNQLLSVVDILVTDYSSIFFDYLVTDKPILFYTWDAEEYTKERDMYLPIEELPGPSLSTIDEVINAIKQIKDIKETYQEKYEKFKQQFVPYDDGNVTERLVNYLFHGKEKLKALSDFDKKKEKIVFYPGGMRNNGITSSMINLLNNIDYEKYDVTCFMGPSNNKDVLNNINKVPSQVRFLFKVGYPLYELHEIYKDEMVKKRGLFREQEIKLYPSEAYKNEVQRLFGQSKFDYAIDFSGYSYYWAKYLLTLDVKKSMCYMHSDMLADCERTVNGRRPHRQNLRGLFSVYNRFDKLIGVSESTMAVNKESLKEFASPEAFDYILNALDYQKILDSTEIDFGEREDIPLPSSDMINFVTMGRLSPEKGQDNLIRAFGQFHSQHPKSRLYILGEGPVRKELEAIIEELNLEESVFLTGQMDNPFALLRQCQCFVLSSHYEGQPMVLLESLTLGLNIIATDIVANRYVLEDGKYGKLVEDSIEGLADGMLDFYNQGCKTHEAQFDYEEYNEKAMKSFYRVLEEARKMNNKEKMKSTP
ncbi:teichoic acid biosynthesis protein [Priestia megaterium]|nr:teichoic acid biosynthesis protein [Priestia megaterium]